MRVAATIKKIVTILLLVILALGYFTYHSRRAIDAYTSTLHQPPVMVSSYVVKYSPFSQTIQTNAQIKALNSVMLHPKVTGYITHIYVHEGQAVKKGQILIALDHATDKDSIAQTKATLDLAKANYDRSKQLANTGALSKQQIDKLHATYLSDQANYQTSLDTYNDKIIRAPINGIVGSLSLTVGDYVNTATKLTTITDLNHLQVQYSLGANLFAQTHVGDKILVKSAFTNASRAHAKITYKSPTIHANTQTFNVHAAFNNSKQQFSPGETALVSQTLAINPKGIIIPLEAVMTSLTGNHVYLIKHHTAVLQPVTLGLATKNKIQVLTGLKPGDRIILSTVAVHDGSKVKDS